MKTGYTLEFWKWAYEHGFPPRQPRGSPENMERSKMLRKLYSQWLKEQKER